MVKPGEDCIEVARANWERDRAYYEHRITVLRVVGKRLKGRRGLKMLQKLQRHRDDFDDMWVPMTKNGLQSKRARPVTLEEHCYDENCRSIFRWGGRIDEPLESRPVQMPVRACVGRPNRFRGTYSKL